MTFRVHAEGWPSTPPVFNPPPLRQDKAATLDEARRVALDWFGAAEVETVFIFQNVGDPDDPDDVDFEVIERYGKEGPHPHDPRVRTAPTSTG